MTVRPQNSKFLVYVFGEIWGRGWFWGEIFWPNLILDKNLKLCFPKVFFHLKPQEV